MKHCFICSSPAAFACALCETQVYCSAACAALDPIGRHVHAAHELDLVIEPNIYVGSLEAVHHLNDKQMPRIDAVLSVLSSVDEAYLKPFVGKRPHLYVDVDDYKTAPIEQYFDEMADFIHLHADTLGETVLVHCHAGMSRSVTTVIYYMMKYRGYSSPEAALKEIQKYRPVAEPNKGFMRKLSRASRGKK